MSSNVSKSAIYKILARTTALSKNAKYVILNNALRVSKVSKYIVMDGQKPPRRTLVNVAFVTPDPLPTLFDEWRLVGGFCYAYDNTQFREMEWSTDPAGENVLTLGEFDASSELGGAYLKAYATDGDANTLFAVSGSRNYWLSHTVPENTEIGAIRFLPTNFSTQSPKEMIVQKKIDGEWVTTGDALFPSTSPTDMVWNEALVTPYTPPDINVETPHRYWRIMITGAGQSNGYLILERLQLLDSAGVDVALMGPGKTVTYTEQQGTTWAAEHIFEDNANQWASNGQQYRHFIAIDLGVGNAQKVVDYSLKTGNASTSPTGWRIEFSDNGVDWKMADEQYFQTWTSAEVKTFNIGTP